MRVRVRESGEGEGEREGRQEELLGKQQRKREEVL